MSDPLRAFLQASSLEASAFPSTSRYHGLATATWTQPDGRPVAYVLRRFVPSLERFAVVHEHAVAKGDRLDNLAAHYLGDPEQFWRMCDANGAMRPDALIETVGAELRVTLPEGIPG